MSPAKPAPKPRRTPAEKKAQAAYAQRKAAAGEHVQVNVRFKTATDLAMIDRLRARFPDLADAAIVRQALAALDKGANTKP
jgi:hypothetical protein